MDAVIVWRYLFALFVVMASVSLPDRTDAQAFNSPDILVLGDSQISFGAGPPFVDFFSNLETHCAPNRRQQKLLKKLGERRVAVIGVRSTAIHSWTARSGAAKGSICDVDKKWKVNAGSYGVVNKTKNQFVQIGQGRNYQFCAAGKSPFEEMFRKDYYDPKLLVLTFLGNATKRWAEEKELTQNDARRLGAQLPAELPCIFMTTAPAYKESITKKRYRAQESIKKALAREGRRCVFVDGITDQTIAANQGNKSFFRKNKSGGVKDPYHPNKRGARHHLKLIAPKLCEAVFVALGDARAPS